MTDREKVIEGLEKVWDAFNHMEHELYADYVFDALEMLKQAEPVRHAHWIPNGKWVNCSACGVINCMQKYCGQCGAKMDEVTT